MCISVWGVKLWNALPVYIKEIRSLYIFKIKAKAYLGAKKRYEGVMFNVISVTRGWVGVQFPEK